jgi:hypothetical protein
MASPLRVPHAPSRSTRVAEVRSGHRVRLSARADERAAPDAHPRLLVHERAFLALYAAVIVRLGLVGTRAAWHEASWWLALAAASIALAWLAERTQRTGAWRARLAAYLVLMNAAYYRLATVFAVTGGARRDAALRHADTILFGAPLPLLFDGWRSPLLADVLSACYLLLFPYLLIACLRHATRWRRTDGDAVRFYEGLFTVYAVGFVGYLLVPAQGMWLDAPAAFAHPIAGGWLTALDARVVAAGSSRVDVFPSLHVAVSAFILAFDRRTAPWRARLYALPALGLWLSTVYLRYHYGVDVVAGFATAALGLDVAFRRPLGRRSALQ